MPAALLAQVGQRRLGDPQRAEQVGLQLRPDLGLADLLDHAELPVPGVVHDHVQPPEVLVCQPHRGEAAARSVTSSRIGKIASPYLVDQIVEAGDTPGRRRDLVAAVQGRDRPLPAEAPRRAGDEPGLNSHQMPFAGNAEPSSMMLTAGRPSHRRQRPSVHSR